MRPTVAILVSLVGTYLLQLSLIFGRDWNGYVFISLVFVLLFDHTLLYFDRYRFYFKDQIGGKNYVRRSFSAIGLFIIAFTSIAAIHDDYLDGPLRSAVAVINWLLATFSVQILHENSVGRFKLNG